MAAGAPFNSVRANTGHRHARRKGFSMTNCGGFSIRVRERPLVSCQARQLRQSLLPNIVAVVPGNDFRAWAISDITLRD